MSDVSKDGLTFIKGVGLVFGGAALGFFGCLGGLSVNSSTWIVGSLGVGAVVIAVGAGLMLKGFVKGLIGLTKKD
jgi:hypothetical protein